MYKNIIIILVLLMAWSCKETTTDPVETNFDTSYFPLQQGAWKIYDVTSISIDVNTNLFDTVSYQLKELFTDWFVDGEGDSMLILKRYIRSDAAHSWVESGTWYAGIKDNIALQTEENIRYVKFNFPVKLNKEWNGDAYNNQDTINNFRYKYTTIDSLANYNNLSFDKVVTVTQKDKSTLIDKINFAERYQHKVGLIYKQQLDVFSDSIQYGVPIEKRVSKGTFYYQTIRDYGTN